MRRLPVTRLTSSLARIGFGGPMRSQADVAALEAFASTRFGLIRRSEAYGYGVSPRMINRLVSSGEWVQVFGDVFAPRPVPFTWETMQMAAVLQGGERAMTAGKATLRLLGFQRYKSVSHEIAAPRHLHLPEVICHQFRDMTDSDSILVKGIPTRRFEPTLLEMCGDRAEKKFCPSLLDEALRRKLTHLRWLYRTGFQYGKRGRAGTRLYRRLVAMRDADVALTDSELETIFLRMSKRLSRKAVLHHVVKDEDGDHVSEIDFAIPELKVAIPLNGYDPHKMRFKWDGDHKTIVVLQNLGWGVFPFTFWQVRNDFDWVLEQIEIAIRHRSDA